MTVFSIKVLQNERRLYHTLASAQALKQTGYFKKPRFEKTQEKKRDFTFFVFFELVGTLGL